MRIAHLVNPYSCPANSEAEWVQTMSIASIEQAQKGLPSSISIELHSTCLLHENQSAPAAGTRLKPLTRSSADCGFKQEPARPLLNDLIESLKSIKADAYVFTNMDIGLMPQFYPFVAEKLELGHDSLVINRRRLAYSHMKKSSLAAMQSDLGRSHPGFDCFVFRAELLPKLQVGDLIVGIPFMEVGLAHSLFAFSSHPLFIPDHHLTFHVGGEVLPPRNSAMKRHNQQVYRQFIWPRIRTEAQLKNFPYAKQPFPIRALKHMANPALFTRHYLRMQGQSWWQQIKMTADEWRWRFLQR